MAYQDPWREAVENAKELLRLGMPPQKVQERTRLPKSTIDKIAPPILRENAEREAIQEAERALKREHERESSRKNIHARSAIKVMGLLTAVRSPRFWTVPSAVSARKMRPLAREALSSVLTMLTVRIGVVQPD